MKKLIILAMAVAMVAVVAAPAFAVENIFGGYWRVRAFTNQNFSGFDDESEDFTRTDTRTRLYYTAKFSDKFKLVNKFEMDAVFGQGGTSYGDIGADGIAVEVKNSYADFDLGSFNFKIGVQGGRLGRSFLFDDDFAGARITYSSLGGTPFEIPFYWMKANEGGRGPDADDQDVDYYALAPSFKFSPALTVVPYLLYIRSTEGGGVDADGDRVGFGLSGFFKDNSLFGTTVPTLPDGTLLDEVNIYYLGLDVDAKIGPAAVWFTGIYQGGDIDILIPGGTTSVDLKGFLVAGGGSMPIGPFSIHGQAFYASGDEDDDDEIETFLPPRGASYYWSEIMGFGVFDAQVSNNSPADIISNVMAANLGATFKPMPKLSLTADVWYAQLAEDDINGNSELGTEVDLKLTYQLMKGLNLDVVGAYLFAGESTQDRISSDVGAAASEEDPWEIGTRLSLSF